MTKIARGRRVALGVMVLSLMLKSNAAASNGVVNTSDAFTVATFEQHADLLAQSRPDSSTDALLAMAKRARVHADSLGILVADWREAMRQLPRDTVRVGGATLSIWKPWAATGHSALAIANDSMHAIFGSSAEEAVSRLALDITPLLRQDGTPITPESARERGNLPARATSLNGTGTSFPPLTDALDDQALARYLVDAMTRRLRAAGMDAALRKWIDDESSFIVPDLAARQAAYRLSVSRAVGTSTRQCLLGWLQQCPRVFGLRGNTGDPLPLQRTMLLRHALLIGGPDAFTRLMRDTTRSISDRLSDAAGKPTTDIIAAWHADMVSRWRPDMPHVPASDIASTLVCCALLGVVFVRSRR